MSSGSRFAWGFYFVTQRINVEGGKVSHFVSINHPLPRAGDGEAVDRVLVDRSMTTIRKVGVYDLG